jgi:hypothetical protein
MQRNLLLKAGWVGGGKPSLLGVETGAFGTRNGPSHPLPHVRERGRRIKLPMSTDKGKVRKWRFD